MLNMGEMNDRLKLMWEPKKKEELLLELQAEIIRTAKAGKQIPAFIVEAYNALAEKEEKTIE